MKETQTIVIDNFTGSLTRAINGDMNSGLAKFYSSWGYDPFLKPRNLTWVYTPLAYGSVGIFNGLPLAAKSRIESGTGYFYLITNLAELVKVNSTSNVITLLTTLTAGTPTFAYPPSIEFFNGKIWITNDKGLTSVNFDGTGETQVGTWDSSHFIQNTGHPLNEFQGTLVIGNTTDGTSTNIGIVDSTNTIINYNRLTPAFQTGTYVRDLDITSDFSYLVISLSSIPVEALAPGNDGSNSVSGDSFIERWNGSDSGVTSGVSLPNFGITALNNFGISENSFIYDLIGASLYDGGEKKLSLPRNKSPLLNATASSGNILAWMCPEVAVSLSPAGQTSLNSLYFYGKLDEESSSGLWRIFRQVSEQVGGSVNQVPFMLFLRNQYTLVNTDGTLTNFPSIIAYSRYQFTSAAITPIYPTLYRFAYANGAELVGQNVVSGVYETQTQLFPKKVSTTEVRIYCEPTANNNSFQFDLIGIDGIPISGGTFTYTFVAGTDITKLQGSLNRINYNTNVVPTFAMGVRITNLGPENMVINKVEIDYGPAGK